MLISEGYREQNRLLHEQNPKYGISGARWVDYVEKMISDEKFESVLDYGCGKGVLAIGLAERGKMMVREYDPAIPGKDAPPEPAELVVCTDVLEHIEPQHINALIRDLRRVTLRKVFFNISTAPASKTLPDGRNTHLIVQGADWWRHKITREFTITAWHVGSNFISGEAVPKLSHVLTEKPTKRRLAGPIITGLLDNYKAEHNKHCDAFSQIRTVGLWEGVDDQPADLMGVIYVVERMPDVDAAMRSICENTRKVALFNIKLDDARPEAWWRKTFERRFRICSFHVNEDRCLLVEAVPMVTVEGIIPVGVVHSDERWTQVETATARFPKRIPTRGVHDSHAVVACYGPSLAKNIDALKARLAEGHGVLVSVSGAHDFLLEHGLVPTYHVECDPRLHKADNIERAHPEVQYLIASTCHPGYFDKLVSGGADIRLWHVQTSEHSGKLLFDLKEKGEHIISGGGSVGLRSIQLLYALGYRTFSYFGMDCSFEVPPELQGQIDALKGEKDHQKEREALAALADGITQWAGKHAGKRQDLCQVDCGGRIFISSPVLLTYATNFFETIQKVTDIDIRMYGDGLLQNMCRYFNSLEQAA